MGEDDVVVKINMASLYKDNRKMIVKFNDVRVTPLIQGREPYPGGGYNTLGDSKSDFLRASSGSLNVKVILPHKVDTGADSVLLYEVNHVLEKGNRYVLHITDTAEFTKSLVTKEDFTLPDSSTSRYRFVNLMPNVPAIDLYYGVYATTAATQTPIADVLVASNIKYLEASEYFTLARTPTRTFKIRPAGAAVTNATVLAYYANANTTLNQKVYTAYALGYQGMATTDHRRPFISFSITR